MTLSLARVDTCQLADSDKYRMFASKLNCVTGLMEWVVTGKDVESEEADFSEEFSRSTTHNQN